VQDIPYNITAITGADLKNYGATDLSKMAQFIPGMQMIDSGARSTNLVTLRGLNVVHWKPLRTRAARTSSHAMWATPRC
jgi:outer membrane receptor for ferrienterochelin and colicin